MQDAIKNNPDDKDACKFIDILYGSALVTSGFTVSLMLISVISMNFVTH